MTDERVSAEMHPTRWGDPIRAAELPQTARGLVEMVFPVADRSVDDAAPVTLPPVGVADDVRGGVPAAAARQHVHPDARSRRLRTRGKSTPDLLRARAGDLSDAPDAVVRPGDADEVQALLAV